jgi:hypothetical protein
MTRTLLTLAALVLGVYALYVGLLFVQQRAMMFPGAGVPIQRARMPAHGREIALPASFGSVRAIALRADRERAPAVLFLHGNYEFVDESLDAFEPLRRAGAHVLLLEYPGYAGSAGAPSQATLAESVRLAYDWLAGQPDVDAARISVFGRSIGTGPAAELLRERSPRAVVLMSPFASIAQFAREQFLWIPSFLIRDPFDNLTRVRAYAGPVLILHGRRDEIIPFTHGERLAAANPRARLVPLDCGHNDCPFFDDPRFLRTFVEFLRANDAL